VAKKNLEPSTLIQMKKKIYSVSFIATLLISSFIFQSFKKNIPMANAEKYKVTTLAGGPYSGQPKDGQGDKASFTSYIGNLTIDATGNLLVLEFSCIRKVSPNGMVNTLFGLNVVDENGKEKKVPEIPREMTGGRKGITGIVVDKKGAILFCAPFARIINKISNEKTVEHFGGGSYGNPGDDKVNPNGDGDLTTVVLRGPTDMCMDKAGNIYLNDKYRMVRKISTNGQVTTLAGKAFDTIGQQAEEPVYKSGTGSNASLANIGGIAVDSKGNVYVSQTAINCILKITPAGAVSTFAGDPTDKEPSTKDGKGTAARFFEPGSLACDASDNIYVGDKRRVRKITPDGMVTTIAGASEDGDFTPAFLDGEGSLALFTYIKGIACDGSGNIYVTDASRVRKIARQ
jgi:hypothetical protein